MSAWVVSKVHVDVMVAAITEGTRDGLLAAVPTSNRDKLGALLVAECVASVSYRYPRDDVSKGELPGPCDAYYNRPYTFEHPGYLPTVAELCKAVHCYTYQSCEHPGWEGSVAKKLCDAIQKGIRAVSREAREMDEARKDRHRHYVWREYEAAPWGFDREDVALCWAKTTTTGAALLRSIRAQPEEMTNRNALSDYLIEEGRMDEPLDGGSFRVRDAAAAVGV